MALPPSSGGDWSRTPGERSGLARYYTTLREHVLLISLCTIVALIAAGVYVEVAPKSYTAQAQLLANPAPSANTVLANLPVLHQSGDPTQDVLTAASLVTTPQVASAVKRQLHLKASPEQLLSQVQATPQGQSDVVSVQAEASTPGMAQQLANTFATQAIAVRTAALHQALALQIPPLQKQVAALPLADQQAPNGLGQELSQLQQLAVSNDPTLIFEAPAVRPGGPSSPQTKLSLAAGLLAGLLIGIGTAFIFSAVDPRLRREEQLREFFPGVPVLARIPNVGKARRPRPLIPSELTPAAIEGYRTLRTTLSSRPGSGPPAYLVTGSTPAEGKTTSAIGLAVALAQAGGRVILIEADLRRPRIAPALGIDVQFGTEQVLIGEVDLERALVPVRVASTSFRVLAAHQAGAGLADRLSLAIGRRLVQSAKELADFVVIDSPPLTAVIDALPLAQISDEILVLARVGESRLNKLADLVELLHTNTTGASGFVLVGASIGRDQRYEYYTQQPEAAAAGDRHWTRTSPAGRAVGSRFRST